VADGKIFYVYVDYTMEKVPRVFYVGKGNERRVKDFSDRNEHWRSIRLKYGGRRDLLVGTKDEEYAFQLEKELIHTYKTYKAFWADGSGWGANFTIGGDGVSGRTRLNMSAEERTKRSVAATGKKQSEETKAKKSAKLKGRRLSDKPKIIHLTKEESNLIRSERMRGSGNHQYGKTGELNKNFGKMTGDKCHFYGKTGELSLTFGREHTPDEILKMSGENNSSAKLTVEKVKQIRLLFQEGKTDTEIANFYDIKRKAINDIRNFKTWKCVISKEKIV
jgi:hypothetical protein